MNNLKPYTRKSWEAGKDGWRNGQRIPHEDIHVIPEWAGESYCILCKVEGCPESFREDGTYSAYSSEEKDLYEAPELKPVVVTYEAVYATGERGANWETLEECKDVNPNAIAYYKVTVDPNQSPENMIDIKYIPHE